MSAVSILVVDDEPGVGIVFKKELGAEGYNVDSVLSGDLALKAIEQKKYDLIFIDKVMPGMDGIETCRKIHQICPDSVLIFMTGLFDHENVIRENEFVEAGGRTYYLYKPFGQGELLGVVRKALKDRH